MDNKTRIPIMAGVGGLRDAFLLYTDGEYAPGRSTALANVEAMLKKNSAGPCTFVFFVIHYLKQSQQYYLLTRTKYIFSPPVWEKFQEHLDKLHVLSNSLVKAGRSQIRQFEMFKRRPEEYLALSNVEAPVLLDWMLACGIEIRSSYRRQLYIAARKTVLGLPPMIEKLHYLKRYKQEKNI